MPWRAKRSRRAPRPSSGDEGRGQVGDRLRSMLEVGLGEDRLRAGEGGLRVVQAPVVLLVDAEVHQALDAGELRGEGGPHLLEPGRLLLLLAAGRELADVDRLVEAPDHLGVDLGKDFGEAGVAVEVVTVQRNPVDKVAAPIGPEGIVPIERGRGARVRAPDPGDVGGPRRDDEVVYPPVGFLVGGRILPVLRDAPRIPVAVELVAPAHEEGMAEFSRRRAPLRYVRVPGPGVDVGEVDPLFVGPEPGLPGHVGHRARGPCYLRGVGREGMAEVGEPHERGEAPAQAQALFERERLGHVLRALLGEDAEPSPVLLRRRVARLLREDMPRVVGDRKR
eukprot:RCo034092